MLALAFGCHLGVAVFTTAEIEIVYVAYCDATGIFFNPLLEHLNLQNVFIFLHNKLIHIDLHHINLERLIHLIHRIKLILLSSLVCLGLMRCSGLL